MILSISNEKQLIGNHHIITYLIIHVFCPKTCETETLLFSFFLQYFLIKLYDIVIDRFETISQQISSCWSQPPPSETWYIYCAWQSSLQSWSVSPGDCEETNVLFPLGEPIALESFQDCKPEQTAKVSPDLRQSACKKAESSSVHICLP